MSETTENPIREAIADAIRDHEVILFMKGTPERPACGFSARTVAALDAIGKEFAAVDILPDPRIRQELSALSNWPTIPQLFVKGELIGGCDIVTEMYETGELAEVVGVRVHDDVVDVVKLRGEHDVLAMRLPADEVDVLSPRQVLWQSTGYVARVLSEVLALPERTEDEESDAARGCWVPVSPGESKWITAGA